MGQTLSTATTAQESGMNTLLFLDVKGIVEEEKGLDTGERQSAGHEKQHFWITRAWYPPYWSSFETVCWKGEATLFLSSRYCL